MDVRLSKTGKVLVAKPLGRWLDEQTAQDLQQVVTAQIENGERHLLLDMSDVVNIDSAGLGTVIRLFRLVPQDGRLVLSGCRPALQQLLEKTRIDTVLACYPSAAEALASFAAE